MNETVFKPRIPMTILYFIARRCCQDQFKVLIRQVDIGTTFLLVKHRIAYLENQTPKVDVPSSE